MHSGNRLLSPVWAAGGRSGVGVTSRGGWWKKNSNLAGHLSSIEIAECGKRRLRRMMNNSFFFTGRLARVCYFVF